MKYLLVLTIIFSSNLFGFVPTIEASYETTPIPAGIETTDDTAIWLHPTHPEKSRIIGVSKNKIAEGGKAGIAVYNLRGNQIQFIEGDRLNNVDTRYNFILEKKLIDIAAATNRDKKAISVYQIQEGLLKHLDDLRLTDKSGNHLEEEPYGLCLGHNKRDKFYYVFAPMKSGKLYQYILLGTDKLRLSLLRTLDTSKFLTKEQDDHLIDIVIKDVLYEYNLPQNEMQVKLSEQLAKRFQLEGCVYDDEQRILYYGMENLGIWKLDFNGRIFPRLMAKVVNAKSQPNADVFDYGVPRLTNDIEGLSLHYGPGGQGALVVSVQGIDEFAFFNRATEVYMGSFKLNFGTKDPITQTDGINLLSTPLGPEFPFGLFVTHDHHNTDEMGLHNANYKLTSLDKIFDFFPKLKFENYLFDPRD